jgi:hypothetical protein
MNNRIIACIAASTLVVSTLVACNDLPGSSSKESSAADTATTTVTPPCPNAELHSGTKYDDCRNGKIVKAEKDIWCCPEDNSQRETDTVLETTDQPCGTGETISKGEDAGADAPPPPCTASTFSNPTVVAGGVVQFNVIPSPADCSVTINPTGLVPITDWGVSGNGSSTVTVKGRNQPDPGSVSYTYTCTCPKGDGSPGSGGDTVTFSG